MRCELFVRDLEASLDFYSRVLDFVQLEEEADGYVPLGGASGRISLNRWDGLGDDHHFRRHADAARFGVGVELVLEVADLDAAYRRARESGWPALEPLRQQAWGLTDFRLIDPDGYYLRITNGDNARPLP
jgi:catechol 2,3-dioxygenase-like lactoylglutathione lyase family enzyme